jgi:hypothetical protein
MRVVVYRKPSASPWTRSPAAPTAPRRDPVQEVRPSPSPCGVPPLDQASGPYATFDPLIDGYTKVILKPEFP